MCAYAAYMQVFVVILTPASMLGSLVRSCGPHPISTETLSFRTRHSAVPSNSGAMAPGTDIATIEVLSGSLSTELRLTQAVSEFAHALNR